MGILQARCVSTVISRNGYERAREITMGQLQRLGMGALSEQHLNHNTSIWFIVCSRSN
jgi:hypothetical protein